MPLPSEPRVKPYYEASGITIYHGDCRHVLPSIEADVLVTDPPYPNRAGHFDNGIEAATEVLGGWPGEAIVFWSRLQHPLVPSPLVAVHIWHRTNVNGCPYEAVYHFDPLGRSRRSDVLSYGVFFPPRGYVGDLHPTRKPTPVMRDLLKKTRGSVVDPFCGSGATLCAAKNLGRRAIGIEIEERYCEIAAQRLSQEVSSPGDAA